MLSEDDQKFDRLAGIYDFLVHLVFGKVLEEAQYYFLDELPEKGKVLIIGGGSGTILEKISTMNSALKIYYVEASGAMMELAKKRTVKNPVSFIQGNEQMLPSGVYYDAVLTPFFLDLFGPERLDNTLNILDQSLKVKGLWLFTDFYIPKKGISRFFGKTLIFIMYRFFRLLCRIDARRLPDFDLAFKNAGYNPVKTQLFYGGIVRSQVLRRKDVEDMESGL